MDDVSKALCLLTALGNVLEDVLGNVLGNLLGNLLDVALEALTSVHAAAAATSGLSLVFLFFCRANLLLLPVVFCRDDLLSTIASKF